LKKNSDAYIQNNCTINIHGISQVVTKSKGLTSIKIQTYTFIIPHDFHIVNLKFAIPCARILRIDFIKKYNCQLDFKPSEDWLIIRPNKYPIYVPVTYSSGNNSLILPARSQVVRKTEINSAEDSVLIQIPWIIPYHKIAK